MMDSDASFAAEVSAIMNVHPTSELETLVHKRVKSGREIRRKIDQGWTSLERGEGIDGDVFFVALEREEQKLERKRNPARLENADII
jgi:hypothetical protein